MAFLKRVGSFRNTVWGGFNWGFGIALILALLATRAAAFSLLGPFADWMVETNGYRQATPTVSSVSDIGGPMDIGSEYRWNVPVVTYGFDKSFLDYFGTNGVAAVESAIQVLNDLPPASDIVLTNYPFESQQINYQAQSLSLYDLKSETLSLLLEQMGLATPTRYVFALRRWDPIFLTYPYELEWPDGTIPYYIVQRNFDPDTLAPSEYVNDTLYGGYAFPMTYYWPNDVLVYVVNPTSDMFTAVADAQGGAFVRPSFGENQLWFSPPLIIPGLNPSGFYTGLTRDDVGGLRYLLSADNVNYEKLLPDVRTFGPRRGGVGNGAWRPGVEKIIFVRQPTDPWSRRFRPFNYCFTDAYLKNNVLKQQRAEREVRQPDFLFCAADTGDITTNSYAPWIVRTGTTHWLNNAILNGNTNGEGPGVIQPPIKITFHKLGVIVFTGDSPDYGGILNQGWGSFDSSTNLPVVYPSGIQPIRGPLTIRFHFFDTDFSPPTRVTNYIWHLSVPVGGWASLEISTNQTDWTPLATVTNAGSVIEWDHDGTDNPPKFFRAIPQ